MPEQPTLADVLLAQRAGGNFDTMGPQAIARDPTIAKRTDMAAMLMDLAKPRQER